MVNEEVNYCDSNLYELLTKNGKLFFVFRTGRVKQIQLQAHQLPMKNSYLAEHQRALTRVRFISHRENSTYFLLVSARSQGNLERQEYLVKRAILDLSKSYGWEVQT